MQVLVTLVLSGMYVPTTFAQTPPNNPPGNGTGPWNNDVAIYKYNPNGNSPSTPPFQRLYTFPRAGVSTLARLKDGRLMIAFQNFPENDQANFDKVAVSFSSDAGRNWTAPKSIIVTGMDAGLQRPFDPTAVPLPDGKIRLYFTSSTSKDMRMGVPQIYSAISSDGINYIFEKGVRFGVPSKIVIDCAVALHNGTFHLISPDNGDAKDLTGPGPGAETNVTRNTGYHAVSQNGLNFTRVANVTFTEMNNKWLGNMLTDKDDQGRLRLVFFGTGPGPWPMSSVDGGLTWSSLVTANTNNNNLRLPGADPGGVKMEDGTWLISVTAPKEIKPPQSRKFSRLF